MSGWFYHKECLKCLECSRGPDADTPMMLGELQDLVKTTLNDWCFRSQGFRECVPGGGAGGVLQVLFRQEIQDVSSQCG